VRVAREAGVAQGHLTYYFPRKSDLAAAVVERLSRDARSELEPMLARAAGADEEAQHDLFFSLVQKLLRNDRRNRVMLGLVAEALDDRELAGVLARQLQMQRAVMAHLLGRAPDDPDVHIALAALRGLGIENLLHRSDPAHAEAILARFRVWLDGWKTAGTKAQSKS
jgi:AcrR family transcriptional regulator